MICPVHSTDGVLDAADRKATGAELSQRAMARRWPPTLATGGAATTRLADARCGPLVPVARAGPRVRWASTVLAVALVVGLLLVDIKTAGANFLQSSPGLVTRCCKAADLGLAPACEQARPVRTHAFFTRRAGPRSRQDHVHRVDQSPSRNTHWSGSKCRDIS
jgi:hypothetical protein